MRSWTGPILALGVLVLDQLTKWAVLRSFDPDGALVGTLPCPFRQLAVTEFFNLVLVCNRGVSFGMLDALGEHGPWLLTALAAGIGAFLIVWLYRETRTVTRIALWLVLAGAVGNSIDRIRFGAVIDFLDFHLLGYHWPAFNVADSAIVVGALLILLDSLVLSQSRTKVRGQG